MTPIRKAVFPVAGLGTRFLPATKASPKEMLPIVDKPLIQYAVEEAIQAGCDEMIFIIGRAKEAIINHFDKAYELENELAKKQKTALLEIVQNVIPSHITTVFTRQNEALGLGHAVLCAQKLINDEPFAVILADDLIQTGQSPNCLAQMCALYQQQKCSIIGLEAVPAAHTDRYGVIKSQQQIANAHILASIVEKPAPEHAPSNLAVVGRYILTPEIFNHLATTQSGTGGEIQLTDAIAQLLKEQKILGLEFSGTRFDCGDKLGYLKATIAYALEHPELAADFAQYLRSIQP